MVRRGTGGGAGAEEARFRRWPRCKLQHGAAMPSRRPLLTRDTLGHKHIRRTWRGFVASSTAPPSNLPGVTGAARLR